MRKSEQLGLSFPYDWSNPEISDEALIINVLERGIYEDICRVCAAYGLEVVDHFRVNVIAGENSNPSLARMFSNIEKGFARAQTR